MVRLMLLFFFRSKIGLRRPAVRLRSIVDPPEGRGCCCALSGCSDDVRDQATLPVSSPFQAVAPLAAGLHQAGARSASAPSSRSRADIAADVPEGRRRRHP